MNIDNVKNYLTHKNEFNKGAKNYDDVEYLKKIIPEIYTPTIGEICLNYHINTFAINGLYLEGYNENMINENIKNFKNKDNIKIIVVTDGSRILGYGDLGYNGYPICDAKIFIHRIFNGYGENECLPIFIDLGTNNQKLLNNEKYKGCLKERKDIDTEVSQIMKIIDKINNNFSRAIIHFEDFNYPKSKKILKNCLEKNYNIFNDDIEGTGIMVLVALKNISRIENFNLLKKKILFLGAGSVTYGITEMIIKYFKINKEQIEDNIILIDSKGLVNNNSSYKDDLKNSYAKNKKKNLTTSEVIKFFDPEIIIGAAGIPDLISDNDLKSLLLNHKKPKKLIVLSLGNPYDRTEIKYSKFIQANKESIYYASGTKIEDSYQLNNYLSFPLLAKKLNQEKDKSRNEIIKDVIDELINLTDTNSLLPDITNLISRST